MGDNRLYLNFNGNDRMAGNDRAYPTTPSTFPQPVFPPQGGQPQQGGGGLQPGQAYGGQQYAQQQQQQGYFPQQGQYAQQQQVNDYAATQNAAYQPRSNTPGNDPNQGLANQFSHQNLGGQQRAAQYAQRGAPPGQRPRTADSRGQPPPHGSHGTPPVPSQGAGVGGDFQPAPERNPDRYGSNANSNQKKCSQLAADFFKDSVKRARERNQR